MKNYQKRQYQRSSDKNWITQLMDSKRNRSEKNEKKYKPILKKNKNKDRKNISSSPNISIGSKKNRLKKIIN